MNKSRRHVQVSRYLTSLRRWLRKQPEAGFINKLRNNLNKLEILGDGEKISSICS